MHGWIILDKPVGLGSTQAVGAVKRLLREGGFGKVKVGHGGTLDPLASGVLPIAIGEATKLAGPMLDASKVYEFTVTFGAETDTLDLEGSVVATCGVQPTLAEIEAVLPRFTGAIEQMPPAYSALKVDGRRSYDLARAGEAVALNSRAVTIHALRVSAPPCDQKGVRRRRGDAEKFESITLTADVSKGTYIRSLARDIAHALATVAHVTMLRRTRAGPFALDHAISLDNLREAAKGGALERAILPLMAGLDDIPALSVTPAEAAVLRQGRVLTGTPANHGLHLATEGLTPVALVEVSDGTVRVVRGFNL